MFLFAAENCLVTAVGLTRETLAARMWWNDQEVPATPSAIVPKPDVGPSLRAVRRGGPVGLVGAPLDVAEQFLGPVPVLGVADVHPPAVHPDGVDGASALDQEVDGVRNLVLAPVRRLDEVAGVEDRRRERVEARHHQVRRRVLGLLDDVDDLAVLVGVTDPVARGLVPRHFLDEEGGVGAVLALAIQDVLEVRLEDVVAQHQHEVAVDVLLDGEQGVGQPLLFALVGVGDGHALELVVVVADDDLFLVADDDEEFVGAQIDELFETVG